MKKPDGRTYTGEYVNGKATGKGSIKMPDGTTFEGDWLDGKLYGKGLESYSEWLKENEKTNTKTMS